MYSHEIQKGIDSVFSEFINSEEERKLIDTSYEIQELKKGELFLQKNDAWYKFGILIQGSIYSYYFNEKGEKCITGFYYYPQNYYVVDYETFVKETKITLWYECFEDTIVLLFNGLKFNQLYKDIPGIHKTRLKLAEDRYFRSLNVIKLLQSPNANEKVQELYHQSPELFKLFPYSYIASYLGLHRNTYRRALSKLKL
jgi:hypothetical protein